MLGYGRFDQCVGVADRLAEGGPQVRSTRGSRLLVAVFSAAVMLTMTGVPAAAVPPPLVLSVAADGETTPVDHSGDAADDPAIWVHPSDPSASVVIGNDKQGALEVYDLTGARIQRITTPTGSWGNVDVRQAVTIGGRTLDVVGAVHGGMRFYTVDPDSRQLSLVTDGTGTLPSGGGEGFCLYTSGVSGRLYAFVNDRGGQVRQFEIHDADGDGLLQAALVREFSVGSETEGCVADDETGALYISEEDVALWRYEAEPGAGGGRTKVDEVGTGGYLAADIEGLTLVHLPGGGGYLIASAQNVADPSNSYFAVYERTGGNAFVAAFRVVSGAAADGCQRTDGIAAYPGSLGPSFPTGLFVCQDNNNTEPGSSGNQSFKLVQLGVAVAL
jgi:myo-inositol-hexaphosphate 3-phosphohydrolase